MFFYAEYVAYVVVLVWICLRRAEGHIKQVTHRRKDEACFNNLDNVRPPLFFQTEISRSYRLGAVDYRIRMYEESGGFCHYFRILIRAYCTAGNGSSSLAISDARRIPLCALVSDASFSNPCIAIVPSCIPAISYLRPHHEKSVPMPSSHDCIDNPCFVATADEAMECKILLQSDFTTSPFGLSPNLYHPCLVFCAQQMRVIFL